MTYDFLGASAQTNSLKLMLESPISETTLLTGFLLSIHW